MKITIEVVNRYHAAIYDLTDQELARQLLHQASFCPDFTDPPPLRDENGNTIARLTLDVSDEAPQEACDQ